MGYSSEDSRKLANLETKLVLSSDYGQAVLEVFKGIEKDEQIAQEKAMAYIQTREINGEGGHPTNLEQTIAANTTNSGKKYGYSELTEEIKQHNLEVLLQLESLRKEYYTSRTDI